MSGGFLEAQPGRGEHQLVIFTFKGTLNPQLVAEWNQAILNLKQRFGNSLVGVTIRGATTSDEFLG